MSNDYNTMGFTGKYPRKMEQPESSHLAVPFVSKADLLLKGSVLNDATKSGKQEGAFFLTEEGGELHIQIAHGSMPEDKWTTLALTTDTPPEPDPIP